jgi:glycogen(starch) synthase
MRTIIFSWEYPPRVVGKLAEYVSTLATQLQKNRVETYVVTYNDEVTGVVVEPNGAQVTRVANPVRTHINLLTWILTLNQEVEREAATIYYQTNRRVDVIDVHDWHFIPAAVTLKKALGIPYVYSVDSLEDHRSPGANAPLNMAIRGIEWLGFFETPVIIAKSEWMQNEIARIHKVSKEKIVVIPTLTNGGIKNVIDSYKTVAEAATTQ